MIKAFISHSSDDKQFTNELAANLKKDGVDVWYDAWSMKVGDSLREKISEGIDSSDFMIVVLSRNSMNSKWVKEELNAGLAKSLELSSVYILPVFLDGENNSFPTFLKDKLYADFRDSYNTGYRALLNSIFDCQYETVDFITMGASRNYKETLENLGQKEILHLSSFVNGIKSDGTAFYDESMNLTSFYEAECEMYPTVQAFENLVLYGLITNQLEIWDLSSRPKTYKFAGTITKLGCLISKELKFEDIKSVVYERLPGR